MLLLVLLLLPRLALFADDESTGSHREELTRQSSVEMSRRIDELLAQSWRDEGIIPAPLADDSEFMRRVYLDLTGVIPTVAEARAFLASREEDKRPKLIEDLLRSPGHATHLANVWRSAMLPNGLDREQLGNALGLQNWLRGEFVDNYRYDGLVADLLIARGSGENGPGFYYTSLEMKPEKLAASTARMFLGLQIQCAECHDHFFDHWTQRDFWGFAAFFGQLEQSTDDQPVVRQRIVDLDRGEVTLPGTDTVVMPKYPGGAMARKDEWGTRRLQLSIWMASRDNPFLARAAVNRAWAVMFGRGLVEPIDDMGEHNPASHPRVLDELSNYFARSQFDLRELFRTLANTDAYQRSSGGSPDASPPPESFARMAIKTLTAEQLYDCIEHNLWRRPNRGAVDRFAEPRRQQFMARMGAESRSATQYERGVPQALLMMNGPEIMQASNEKQSGILSALDAPFLTDRQRVEILFLSTLSRFPRDDEETVFMEHVRSVGSDGDSTKALGDVLWALLNCAEFAVNH